MNERWSSRRDIADYAVHSRLQELPRRCQMLAGGLDNSENDPELVFAGLTFGDVMAVARRDAQVYVTIQQLRPEQFARLFGAAHRAQPAAVVVREERAASPTLCKEPSAPARGGIAL